MAKRRWLKYTPWARGLAAVFNSKSKFREISESELVFGLLVWCGMPRANAYSVAFPETQASAISLPQLASRLANSWRLRSLFEVLAKAEYNNGYRSALEFRYPRDIEETRH